MRGFQRPIQPRLIIGHTTETTAKIWVKGDAARSEAVVRIRNRDEVFSSERSLSTDAGFSTVIEFFNLSPGTSYEVTAQLSDPNEDKPVSVHGAFKTQAPVHEIVEMKMLVNSCNFHGWAPFVRENSRAVERRAEIAEGTDIVLHLGDQIYADKPFPSVSLKDFRDAYVRGWGDPGTLDVLATRPNYMIPSDHEIINGYARDGVLDWSQKLLLALRGQGFKPQEETLKTIRHNAEIAYIEFQNSHAPTTETGTYYYSFAYGPYQFFALDQRFERSIKTGEMVSARQLSVLLDWLHRHRGGRKIILAESPFITEMAQSSEKWYSEPFRAQRDTILDYLANEEVGGVLFLAGDVHASCHSTMRLRSTSGRETVIHELVSSPVNGTLMKSHEQFSHQSSGITDSGVTYRSRIEPQSFLGASSPRSVDNSNVMLVTLRDDNISYEVHRTRRTDREACRKGTFRFSVRSN